MSWDFFYKASQTFFMIIGVLAFLALIVFGGYLWVAEKVSLRKALTKKIAKLDLENEEQYEELTELRMENRRLQDKVARLEEESDDEDEDDGSQEQQK